MIALHGEVRNRDFPPSEIIATKILLAVYLEERLLARVIESQLKVGFNFAGEGAVVRQ